MVINLIQTVAFAAYAHREQRRKDAAATPYINHPIQVADCLVSSNITDISTLQAALLHDVIEDTAATYKDITNLCGKEVADIVMELTEDKSLPHDERKRLTVEHAPMLSYKAKLIKLADLYDNVSTISKICPAKWPTARKTEYCNRAEKLLERIKVENTILPDRLWRAISAARARLG